LKEDDDDDDDNHHHHHMLFAGTALNERIKGKSLLSLSFSPIGSY
jgi:hypothetical protein